MGGFIGAELAIQHPARVERLVLVAAAGLSIESIRTERKQGLRHRAENIVFFTLGQLASRSHQVALRPRLRAALLLIVAAHPAELPGPLAAQQVLGSGKPGFSDALEAMCRYPLRDRLREDRAARRSSSGATRTASCRSRTRRSSRSSSPTRARSSTRTPVTSSMIERPARFNADVQRLPRGGAR